MVKLNMKTAAIMLLIVSATFINTECFRIFEKRQDIATGCQGNITNCAPTLFDLPYVGSNIFNFGTLAPIIDQFCSDYQIAIQCLGPVLEYCRTFGYVLTNIDELVGFFCSNHGKSLLREFQQSVCYNDFPDVYPYWSTCWSEARENLPGYNGYSFGQCLARSFTADCGVAAGQIVSAILNIAPQNDADNEIHA